MKNKYTTIIIFAILVIIFANNNVLAQEPVPDQPLTFPKISINVDSAEDSGNISISLQILAIMTILSLAPAILILMTSFTRIIVIFHFVRQALGTQQMPSNQILIGLSLFLSFFVMSPVWTEINDKAVQPYLAEEINDTQAFEEAVKPIRNFMLRLTREQDLMLFMRFSSTEKPYNQDDVSMRALIPAFVISELRIAFQIGFLLYIPFLMIDMIVASILMSMGMLMLPPIMISLPFKIMLFVLVDGWYLIVNSVVTSFVT
ncbi:flagellar type III secretion system pore protein FliP [candidate division KSB1 bacterium]